MIMKGWSWGILESINGELSEAMDGSSRLACSLFRGVMTAVEPMRISFKIAPANGNLELKEGQQCLIIKLLE